MRRKRVYPANAVRRSADERSPARFDLHQALTGQGIDDLARGGLGYPVVLADLPQAGHLLTRLEFPGLDLLFERSEHPL